MISNLKAKENAKEPFEADLSRYFANATELNVQIVAGNAAGLFSLDPDLNLFGKTFDREANDMHRLVVSVARRDTAHFVTLAQLNVAVEDVNDNAPILEQVRISCF